MSIKSNRNQKKLQIHMSNSEPTLYTNACECRTQKNTENMPKLSKRKLHYIIYSIFLVCIINVIFYTNDTWTSTKGGDGDSYSYQLHKSSSAIRYDNWIQDYFVRWHNNDRWDSFADGFGSMGWGGEEDHWKQWREYEESMVRLNCMPDGHQRRDILQAHEYSDNMDEELQPDNAAEKKSAAEQIPAKSNHNMKNSTPLKTDGAKKSSAAGLLKSDLGTNTLVNAESGLKIDNTNLSQTLPDSKLIENEKKIGYDERKNNDLTFASRRNRTRKSDTKTKTRGQNPKSNQKSNVSHNSRLQRGINNIEDKKQRANKSKRFNGKAMQNMTDEIRTKNTSLIKHEHDKNAADPIGDNRNQDKSHTITKARQKRDNHIQYIMGEKEHLFKSINTTQKERRLLIEQNQSVHHDNLVNNKTSSNSSLLLQQQQTNKEDRIIAKNTLIQSDQDIVEIEPKVTKKETISNILPTQDADFDTEAYNRCRNKVIEALMEYKNPRFARGYLNPYVEPDGV